MGFFKNVKKKANKLGKAYTEYQRNSKEKRYMSQKEEIKYLSVQNKYEKEKLKLSKTRAAQKKVMQANSKPFKGSFVQPLTKKNKAFAKFEKDEDLFF